MYIEGFRIKGGIGISVSDHFLGLIKKKITILRPGMSDTVLIFRTILDNVQKAQ